MRHFTFTKTNSELNRGIYQAMLILFLSGLFFFKAETSFAQPLVQVALSPVSTTLEKPKEVALDIPKTALTVSEDLAMHLSLAKQYAAENKFELAYLEKKEYLKKYRLFRKEQRNEMSKSLTKDYEIDEKTALNEKLKSKNEWKLLRVAEIQQQKRDQQYHFILIISVALIFILLFFRQLKIRNKLIRLAKIDPLTGLDNRNSLFEHGQRLAKKFLRLPYDFSVLLLDLDYFKNINDSYGHQIGDQVLIIIAELINETMRSRDVLARLGGEEFVALLPYADANTAKAIAMRINEKIAEHNFSAVGCKSSITLSIGVASMTKENNSFDELLHGADLAMYQAKKQGRNKVINYQNIAAIQERRGI